MAIEKGNWIRVVKPTGGKNPIPVGLNGYVFWTGIDNYGNARLGVDLNGNGDDAVLWMNASKCEAVAPETPKGQSKLFTEGCATCGDPEHHDGEPCPSVRRTCGRCEKTLCPDGCCGCICGEPDFEASLAMAKAEAEDGEPEPPEETAEDRIRYSEGAEAFRSWNDLCPF